jgi:diadenosine tetraphosphate (Ap4A) HIT family hydrolase
MNKIIDERIKQIKAGKNPFFIAELHTGYIVLGDHQRFRGYTLFLCKHNAHELHELDSKTKVEFLEEMSIVAECVWQAFNPIKLNYELLGNGDPHMHWHIFPRYKDDGVKGPVWWLPVEEMKVVLPPHEMAHLKQKLIETIKRNLHIQRHIIKLDG